MSSQPPLLQAEYGADEIGAIVLDPGYSVTRAGFAGEDVPKSVVSSYYGSIPSAQEGEQSSPIFDDAIHNPEEIVNKDKPAVPKEIKNPMGKDSTVEDWDIAAKLFEYSITSRLTGFKQTSSIRNGLNDKPADGDVEMEDVEQNEKPLAESPLLMTEPGWNPLKNRERAIEIAMEDWGTPAFYLARSGVMSAFASGKPTALVIDIGASTTGITAVHDGLMLKKGTFKSNLAGNWISDQLRLIFSAKKEFQLVPHYLVQSKTPVDAGKPAQALLRSFNIQPTESFRRLQEERVLTEFKESCVQVWNPMRTGGATNQTLETAKEHLIRDFGKPFEFPNGYNDVFGFDRYRAAESLFDEKQVVAGPDQTTEVTRNQTIPGMAGAALGSIDVDLRSQVLQNIVVSGGSSLIHGMTDRIHHEIASIYPGTRCRIVAPGMIVERKYASWIGASILASLGSFHQLWISKKEYDENGANVVEKRCK